jgi:hypothetical protein
MKQYLAYSCSCQAPCQAPEYCICRTCDPYILGDFCVQTYGPFSERATATVMYECLKIISVCHSNGE